VSLNRLEQSPTSVIVLKIAAIIMLSVIRSRRSMALEIVPLRSQLDLLQRCETTRIDQLCLFAG